jgi:hypothetical protein
MLSRFLTCALLFCLTAAADVLVVFRYDDYTNNLRKTEIEQWLFDQFESRGMPLSVAVIPLSDDVGNRNVPVDRLRPLDGPKLELLRLAAANGRIEVMQHGYTHQYQESGADALGSPEFTGLSQADQQHIMQAGRQALEAAVNQEANIFVPPNNWHDADTVRAADELGYRILAADYRIFDDPSPVELRFIPYTCLPQDFERALRQAQQSDAGRLPVVVLMLHAYDFPEYDAKQGVISKADFSVLLDRLQKLSSVRVVSFAEALAAVEDGDRGDRRFGVKEHLDYARFRTGTLYRVAGPFRAWFDPLYIPERAVFHRTRAKVIAALAGVWGGIALTGMLSTVLGLFVLRRIHKSLEIIGMAGGIAVAVAGLVLALKDGPVYFNGACAMALSAGIILSVLLSLCMKRLV